MDCAIKTIKSVYDKGREYGFQDVTIHNIVNSSGVSFAPLLINKDKVEKPKEGKEDGAVVERMLSPKIVKNINSFLGIVFFVSLIFIAIVIVYFAQVAQKYMHYFVKSFFISGVIWVSWYFCVHEPQQNILNKITNLEKKRKKFIEDLKKIDEEYIKLQKTPNT